MPYVINVIDLDAETQRAASLPPSMPATRRLIAADVTRAAIRGWEEANQFCNGTYDRAAGDGELETWTDLANMRQNDAKTHLVQSIIAWHLAREGKDLPNDAEMYYYNTCGVSSEGTLYLAMVDDDDTPHTMKVGEKRNGDPVMRLVVVSMNNVVNLDTKRTTVAAEGDIEAKAETARS